MSKKARPYIPPRVTKHACEAFYSDAMEKEIVALRSEIKRTPFPQRDEVAEDTKVFRIGGRNLEPALTSPIHRVCDICWKPAAMAPFAWMGRGEGALCCFCGTFTTSGKQVACWALDVICENKH